MQSTVVMISALSIGDAIEHSEDVQMMVIVPVFKGLPTQQYELQLDRLR